MTVIVPVYVHSICVYIAQYSVRFAVQYVLNVYCTYVCDLGMGCGVTVLSTPTNDPLLKLPSLKCDLDGGLCYTSYPVSYLSYVTLVKAYIHS